MNNHLPDGEIVVESQTYSLVQVCVICGVTTDLLLALVEFGVIVPLGELPTVWRFNEYAVGRAKKALRLHHDLGLDFQGLALSLELLDEIDCLRAQIAGHSERKHYNSVRPFNSV